MARHEGRVLRGLLVAAAVAWCPAAQAVDDAVDRRIKEIKAPASQRKWQQTPWTTDLAAAQRVARRENRPILLWVSGDDPLERC